MNGDAAASKAFDIAVIGAGAAGMWTALCAANQGASVTLISRKPLAESASFHAQGGLAAALEPGDSPEQHAADTLSAGRGMCVPDVVEVLTREAPRSVEELIDLGVEFDRKADGNLELGLEGGHTRRRIIHSGGSSTGIAITARLAEAVGGHDRIELYENTSALALAGDGERCEGVTTDRGAIAAGATVLATGGAAALWSRTTNPWGAIGAGPVLALEAGAELADLEFCQFHPTAVHLPGTPFDGMLITEAVRGEGAALLDGAGERFTDELAGRDAVTAAIVDRMGADRTASVGLDLREIDPARFPSIFDSLAEAGLEPRARPIPIAPAAHYVMGGIAVDSSGRSSLPGLFAVGECSCSGLHGANRLASNSLTECFVFGRRAALAALEAGPAGGVEPRDPGRRFRPPTEDTRKAVWKYAGPLRDPAGLDRLAQDPYPLARQIAMAALARLESRGGHRRSDCPAIDATLDGIHFFHSDAGTVEPRGWNSPRKGGRTA